MFARTSRSLKIAAAALAIVTSAAVVPGAVTSAEARHGHRHHFHRHVHILPAVLIAASSGCHWMKVRAIDLGSRYWWARYHACRGD